MKLTEELMLQPGVIAAGEYAYRGDRYSHQGEMTEDMAKMASIMCRATSLGVHMESQMLERACPDCGLSPAQGWCVRGPQFSVCVIKNHFCFAQNSGSNINDVLHLMRKKLSGVDEEKI